MRRILLCGGAGSLGESISKEFPSPGDEVWLSSRRSPESLKIKDGVKRLWCPADLSRPHDVDALCSRFVDTPLHGLIYSAGTWETNPDLTKISTSEIFDVMNINAGAFLALARGLRSNLAQSGNARVIAIGSICGLPNSTGSRAVYAASKFAIRGAVHGLRHFFRELPIGVTALSPGPIASIPQHEVGGQRIPAQDIVRIIRMLFDLSAASTLTEIHMPARLYDDAIGQFIQGREGVA